MKKIGILTSGGDCQGLNSSIRSVCLSLFKYYKKDVKIFGFLNGYKGLMEGTYKIIEKSDLSPLLTEGGTIIGSSRQPYKEILATKGTDNDKVKLMKSTYKNMDLDCLVVLGGNGSNKTANLLSKEGLNVVSMPKTIDNDIFGTDVTFGFNSAVDVATNAIDCVRTTAKSHGRVMLVEVMGHKVGWLTLYSGIAGGADMILIPELPYQFPVIVNSLRKTLEEKNYAIMAVAEGAVSLENSLSKKPKNKTASFRLAPKIEEELKIETRVVVPGHTQRGGDISPYDRILTSRLGAFTADMIINKNYGNMASVKGDKIIAVPLSYIAEKLKYVPTDSQVIEAARQMGISFGS